MYIDTDGNYPCYVNGCYTNTNIDFYNKKTYSVEDIHDTIKKAVSKVARGIAFFSITENDTRYEEWLEAFKEYPGCTITATKTIHGDYRCWAILLPINHIPDDKHQGRWI